MKDAKTLTTKMTMPKKEVEEAAPMVSQTRATMERYRLQVDRQTKNSYSTQEAAEAAGAAIKKAHPIVQVTIYDAKESAITLL